ncbi:MAG: hypothetical protein GPOALKHO_000815 [Sodalis sp.]|nr:MAG: hypothetical protein GPOALKHO_000815 [Sodalis sp.]
MTLAPMRVPNHRVPDGNHNILATVSAQISDGRRLPADRRPRHNSLLLVSSEGRR